jgi:hypothetical protein
MQFSERIGAVERVIQLQTMTDRLKNRLWNVPYRLFWPELNANQRTRSVNEGSLLVRLGADFFGMPEDEIAHSILSALHQIKKLALALDWVRFYEFLEFIANDPVTRAFRQDAFVKACNKVLEEELSGYRFIGSHLAPITNREEIATVEVAIAQSGGFAPVATHMATALARLADRPQPDCRNSIKESISAVEAACQLITGSSKATLGQALKKLAIHPALEKGFTAIYGYTSDADGIRHALLDESALDADDARFFLVSCSAFTNYLVARSSQGI